MAREPLKNMLNETSLREFSLAIRSVYAQFNVSDFMNKTMGDNWDDLELMARGRKIAVTLGQFLPSDYGDAIAVIDEAIKVYRGFATFSFTEFVTIYGLSDECWDISVAALGRFTEYFSAEFAVRPFIVKHQSRMMKQMLDWAKSDNDHLRRLASEGCRPALPWGVALANFKTDPSPILPILEILRDDPSFSVRNSVANNLNDISKIHPDLVLGIARRWYGQSDNTNWIVKHGLRTLLKKSNKGALALFGLGNADAVKASSFSLDSPYVSLGHYLTFSFTVLAKETTKARLEYAIDFMKANGKHNRKVFQISEISLKENQTKNYIRKHELADHSTRKHYLGKHFITLIVNGTAQGTLEFELTSSPRIS